MLSLVSVCLKGKGYYPMMHWALMKRTSFLWEGPVGMEVPPPPFGWKDHTRTSLLPVGKIVRFPSSILV